MKMRKVLSFVLVLSLVLGSFSMAFAANEAGLTDIAGNANEDAIQVNYDLGIVEGNPDGTYLPEKAVNRAEFAALITRALAIPDSALAGYTTTTFKDTVGYGWAVPYLAFCQSKGIMIGDGQGNAMPGRTITVNEAMTMALRAIGYTENSSLLVGVWPASYVTIAQTENLYDDVAAETTVNKASAAQIIYNLLTVQKVAVNADGETSFLWKDRNNDVEANLLNTNLGAQENEDVILGVDYDYDNSLINITGKLGAFGTAYTNKDGDLIAFTVDSTALTGKIDGSSFKVGDIKYSFGTNLTTETAVFANTDASTHGALNATAIKTIADSAINDGTTLTINADVSGKRLNDVYSVVAWAANDAELADADVQEEIEDQELLGNDFDLTDDDEIDFRSFQLVGVDSLADIDEDNVVYVYTDSEGDIRKVAVGTETIEGVVEETNEDDKITIDGKEYSFANLSSLDIPTDVDVDSEGIFYLDYAGKVFDFEGTTGTPDTYAVVKAMDPAGFDNTRLRLYLSEDSTKTFTLAEKNADMDVITTTGAMVGAIGSITTGSVIGYSLDSNGDIDAIDLTAKQYTTANFQSTKVLNLDVSRTIDSNAVVFTYEGTMTDGDYDVAALTDVKKGSIASSASPAAVILDGGKVMALLIHDDYVDVDDDDVYGVFNTRRAAKTGDDNVFRFTGFIDGTAFSYKTDDRNSQFENLAGVFGVYKITIDANDVITAVEHMSSDAPDNKYVRDSSSGYIVEDAVIDSLNSSKTVITDTNDDKWTIADDAVVYKYDESDEEFSVAKLSNLRADYTVTLYDTKGSDADGIATVVIYFED